MCNQESCVSYDSPDSSCHKCVHFQEDVLIGKKELALDYGKSLKGKGIKTVCRNCDEEQHIGYAIVNEGGGSYTIINKCWNCLEATKLNPVFDVIEENKFIPKECATCKSKDCA